jgi:predicted nucleic acid-binding protein
MILVDSSVWIDLFRGADNAEVSLLEQALVSRQVVIGDLILLEILQGARSDAMARRLERQLSLVQVLPLMSPALAVRAAKNYRALRALGVTPRKLVDLAIGTYCIENDHELLHRDRNFLPMVQHLGLRTLQPPLH